MACVVNIRVAHLELAQEANSPRSARGFVHTVLTGWGFSRDAIERSQLLVSELVTNAVLYGSGAVEMAVSEVDPKLGIVRIEVCNEGEGEPAMRRAAHGELSGRGLKLVDDLARHWGSLHKDGRTHVWFELGSSLSR